MKNITFNVKGMHCSSCEMLLAEGLADAGAKSAKASWKAGTIEVEYDEKKVSEQQLRQAIHKEGYEAMK